MSGYSISIIGIIIPHMRMQKVRCTNPLRAAETRTTYSVSWNLVGTGSLAVGTPMAM